ncbi:MAG: tyrosine-type recombinase/integrase [Bacteroidetes bacterium]|nr:tyrosine-type recombinase/integrase [Bacteroidota bacterium]
MVERSRKYVLGKNKNGLLSSTFQNHLNHLGYGKGSVEMLPRLLHDFLVFTSKPTDQITPEDITTYHNYISNRPNRQSPGGLSESYISHHIYALKLFFAWQLEVGIIEENPISSLVFKSPVSKPREILNVEEINYLYKATNSHLERAILSIYYGCGLRRSEGVSLNIGDIHLGEGLLYVRDGKGGRRRVVPMSKKVKKVIKAYMNRSGIHGKESSLLKGNTGRRISGDSCNKIIKTLVMRAGIKKHITLHCLRHSIATHLLKNGLSVEYVRAFLGHKHLESTQVYTRVKPCQLKDL